MDGRAVARAVGRASVDPITEHAAHHKARRRTPVAMTMCKHNVYDEDSASSYATLPVYFDAAVKVASWELC